MSATKLSETRRDSLKIKDHLSLVSDYNQHIRTTTYEMRQPHLTGPEDSLRTTQAFEQSMTRCVRLLKVENVFE